MNYRKKYSNNIALIFNHKILVTPTQLFLMKFYPIAVLFSLVTSYGFAADEPSKSALDAYKTSGQYVLEQCRLTFDTVIIFAELGQPPNENLNWAKCVQDAKNSTKADFAAALKSIKKGKPQEALKTYHVALISAIEGIAPGSSERKISYEQRRQSLDAKLTEAWVRFEVEQ